jgi:hypothetical protein
LFISADAAQEKEKREESAAAQWCFKVYSPYSIWRIFINYVMTSGGRGLPWHSTLTKWVRCKRVNEGREGVKNFKMISPN